MIAELGILALIISLAFALLLLTIPTFGLYRKKENFISAAQDYALAQGFFIAIAYVCLTVCFLQDDFTLTYVASNSSVALPWFYKLCAVWGGHEGSMLLWVTIASFWTVLVCICSQSLEKNMRTRVLVVMGALNAGFILFLLCTSNPFARQFLVFQSEGRDLNPLLQDPGFLFHPPTLYMGYAGFSVAFAFAIAALWEGKFDQAWSKWTRPWTLAAWSFLTAGITLGSWWAYRELGWGGFWFWDPVENASFMPWLVGTALLHSLIVSEKKDQLKAWTILLCIMVFSLSLTGTFLVRSGVLTSVHAFAVDPQRGFYILGFLSLVTGGSLLLFALRSSQLKREISFQLFSKESALFLNNVFLVVLMFSVFLGTLYPLLIDALGLGKLSVGAPYFNAVFGPFMLPFMLLMGLGIHINYQKDQLLQVWKRLQKIALVSLLLPFIMMLMLFPTFPITVYIGLVLSVWVLLSTLKMAYIRLQQGLCSIPLSFWGMVLAHCGIAFTIMGILVSSGYGVQKDVRMQPGDIVDLAGFSIQFQKETEIQGPNYRATQAAFLVSKNQITRTIFPEKRIYDVGQMVMTESAIDVTPFRDIYIALGEPQKNHAWTVRLYYKPLVRWIWTGGFMVFLGGFLALVDRSYYRKKKACPFKIRETYS